MWDVWDGVTEGMTFKLTRGACVLVAKWTRWVAKWTRWARGSVEQGCVKAPRCTRPVKDLELDFVASKIALKSSN